LITNFKKPKEKKMMSVTFYAKRGMVSIGKETLEKGYDSYRTKTIGGKKIVTFFTNEGPLALARIKEHIFRNFPNAKIRWNGESE
jgi:hypothetical protein